MSDSSASNKRIAKNSIFLSIRMVIVLGISLYTTRVILQMLGVVDYGVYNVVCGFVAMFAFLNTSMSNGIQRFFNYEYGKNGEEGVRNVYCTSLYIQVLLAFIVVVLIEVLGLWYLHNKMVIPIDRMVAAEWIFQFAVLSFVFVIMQAPFVAAIMAHERMDFYAIVSVIDAILKLGIAFLLLIIPGDKLIIYGELFSLISIINFFLYYWYCKKHFDEIKLIRCFDRNLFKSMLTFSWWNLFGSFSGIMKEQGVNLVMNFFFGPIVNAARGISAQINSAIQGFVSNMLIPVRPQVIQSYACGDIDRVMSLTYSISKFSSCFFFMMAIPIAIEIDYVLRLWLGDVVPDYANIFTILIFLISFVGLLNSAISTVVHATGIMKQYQFWGSMVSISSVPISFVLLKVYSFPEIALITVFVCSFISHVICLFIVRKLVGMSLVQYFRKTMIPILLVLVISLLVSIPVRLLLKDGLLRFVCILIESEIAIVFSLYFIALNKGERILLSQLWDSAKKKMRIK